MRVAIIGSTSEDSKARLISEGLRQLRVSNKIVFSVKSKSRYRNFIVNFIAQVFPTFEVRRQMRIFKGLDSSVEVLINTEQELHPEVVARIKSLDIKVIFWFPDGVGNISDRQYLFSAPYDHIFLTDPEFASLAKNLYGVPAHYLPEACNPGWHYSDAEFGVSGKCIVIGNYYPSRLTLLQRLLKDGIPLELHGNYPKRWVPKTLLDGLVINRALFTSEKADAFRKSSVVLNLNHPYDVNSTNQRLYEATCAGGLVLTNHVGNIDKLFEVDEEILTFSNYEELLLKVKFYLNNRDKGLEIANNARRKALESHQITYRLTEIFNIIRFDL